MVGEKQISIAEVRRTISTSLAAAFGFVIALLWNTVVTSGLRVAGVDTTAPQSPISWASFLGVAVVLTIVMIVLIVVIGRWGSGV